MKIFSSSVLLVLLLVAGVASQSNITFETPPAIVPNSLFNFTNSSQDGALIISPKLEILDLMKIDINATYSITNLSLSVYNKSAPADSRSFHQLSLPGDWLHVQSSVKDLSCSMLMEQTTKNMALVNFDRSAGTYKVLGVIPLANFTGSNSTIHEIRATMSVGQNCEIMGYHNGNVTAGYHADANWTSIQMIALPSDWNAQAGSEDLIYAISNNKLYAYNRMTHLYEMKYTLPAFTKFMIRSIGGRVLVWGVTTSVVSNTSTTYMLTSQIGIYVFKHTQTNFKLVGSIDIPIALESNSYPSSMFGIRSSPQLTKFGFSYSPAAGNHTVVSKHVSYGQEMILDLKFSEPLHYFATVGNIDPLRELDFNDYFLVVRNGSSTDGTNSTLLTATPPVEEVYQVIGTNFTFLRSRVLGMDNTTYAGENITRELSGFVKIHIDASVTDSCIVINVFRISNGSYQLVEFDYGNLQSVKKMVKVATPPYLSFVEPTHNHMAKSDNIRQWAYFQDDTTNASNANMTIYTLDNSTAGHFRTANFPLTGKPWKLVFQNAMCKVLWNSVSNAVSVNKEVNGTYVETSRLDTFLNVSAITNSTIYAFSDDCTRARVDSQFFLNPMAGANWTEFTIPANFTLGSVDANITWVLSTAGTIWKFAVANTTLVRAFTPNVPFMAGSMIKSYGMKVAVYSRNATSAWFVAFTVSNGLFTKSLNYSFHGYQAQPAIEISPKLTKVLFFGMASLPAYLNSTRTVPRADMFFIQNSSFKNISFPTMHLQTPAKVKINLGEQFVHLVKLDNSSVPISEIVYYLSRDTVTVKVFERTVSIAAGTEWVRSRVWKNAQQVSFLLSEYKVIGGGATTRMVNITEVNGDQAVFNSENNASYTAQIIEGRIKLCSPGCTDCDCKECLTGYVLDTSSSKCRPCAPGCLTCTETDQTNCLTCTDGTFLNSTNSCEPCDTSCQKCSSLASSCLSCPSGEYYFSGSCTSCPKNCFECSDNTTCTTCRKGFSVTSAGTCRSCAMTCSDCNPDNVTECTSCSEGLFIDGGQCSACPDRCLECSSASTCSICKDGYTPNTAGVCVLQCNLPCLTCLDNQPNACLSCPYSSDLTGSTCGAIYTCNATDSCTDCGYGLNYILVPTSAGAVCTECPPLDKCLQCDEVSSFKCSICNNGYYVSQNGSCSGCHSNCTSCKSDRICTGCAAGWTLKSGQNEGRCRPCSSPCATCEGSSRYCSSCIPGFTRKGWKCRNNTYTGFTIVLSITSSVFMGDIDNIVCKLIAMLKGADVTAATADCDKSELTFEAIVSGSTVVTGSSSSGSASNLQTGLSSGSLGHTITGSSISSYGSASESTSEESSSNMGMIIGVIVGLVVLVSAVVVIVYFLKKKKDAQSVAHSEQENMVVDGAVAVKNASMMSGTLEVQVISADVFDEK